MEINFEADVKSIKVLTSTSMRSTVKSTPVAMTTESKSRNIPKLPKSSPTATNNPTMSQPLVNTKHTKPLDQTDNKSDKSAAKCAPLTNETPDKSVHITNDMPMQNKSLPVVVEPTDIPLVKVSNFRHVGDLRDVLFVISDFTSVTTNLTNDDPAIAVRSQFFHAVSIPSHVDKGPLYSINTKYDNVVLPSMLSVKYSNELRSEGGDRIWAFLGALPGLDQYLSFQQNKKTPRRWVFFVKDPTTKVNPRALRTFLDANKDKDFVGRALEDDPFAPKIIHHYEMTKTQWPDVHTGMLVSKNLIHDLAERIKTRPPKIQFSIDAPFELAKFIKDQKNILLTNSDQFCYSDEVDKKDCFSVAPPRIDLSSSTLPAIQPDEIMFGVKTHTANHQTRVPLLKSTWVKDANSVTFYSDTADESIPSVVTEGVPNTLRGHCGKLQYILHDMWKNRGVAKWFYVADDDTMLSPGRLARLLHMIDPTGARPIIVGEKYGFMINQPLYGYSYPTLGCGMALSWAALHFIVESSGCKCYQSDSPDDMWIGSCLRQHQNRIDLVSHPGFHQEAPQTYNERVLGRSDNVAFHRIKQDNAHTVYFDYLGGGK
eukprot:CFRG0067T1